MIKRWSIYLAIGVLFGLADFYFQELIAGMAASPATWLTAAWGIWLLPIIPIILYEAKTSNSRISSAFASISTWSVSVISYYLFMAVRLIFIGQATRPELHISNQKDILYWSNLKSMFFGDILGGMTEWIVVAMLGGFMIGVLVSSLYFYLRKRVSKRITN